MIICKINVCNNEEVIRFCNIFSRSRLQVQLGCENDEHFLQLQVQPPILICEWHFILLFLMLRFQLRCEIFSRLIIEQLIQLLLLNEQELLLLQLFQQRFMPQYEIFLEPPLFRFFLQQHQLRLETF